MKNKPRKSKALKKRVIHRLLISKGHLEKVIQMTQDDQYCIDIIHQSQAVQSALKKIDEMVLENHLKTCVLKAGNKKTQKQVLLDVMEVVKKS